MTTFPPTGGYKLAERTNRIIYPQPNRLGLPKGN